MKDYSITSPQIPIEKKAKNMGVSLDEFQVPKIIVLMIRSELNKIIDYTNASLKDWFNPMYIAEIGDKKIGFMVFHVCAPAIARALDTVFNSITTNNGC